MLHVRRFDSVRSSAPSPTKNHTWASADVGRRRSPWIKLSSSSSYTSWDSRRTFLPLSTRFLSSAKEGSFILSLFLLYTLRKMPNTTRRPPQTYLWKNQCMSFSTKQKYVISITNTQHCIKTDPIKSWWIKQISSYIICSALFHLQTHHNTLWKRRLWFTYWKVKGFEKNRNDSTIVMAFLPVVTGERKKRERKKES